jgi:hypothetical protein
MSKRFVYVLRNRESPPKYYTGLTSDMSRRLAEHSVAAECSLAVAQLLVDAGADPRIPGWMQLTALHKAEGRRDEEGQRVYALLKKATDRLNHS